MTGVYLTQRPLRLFGGCCKLFPDSLFFQLVELEHTVQGMEALDWRAPDMASWSPWWMSWFALES